MKVNFHDQFLEGWAGVIPPGYTEEAYSLCAAADPGAAFFEFFTRAVDQAATTHALAKALADAEVVVKKAKSEDGKTGSDDSSFVVIFYRACQPPSLRVSSIRYLPSNFLASDASQDRYFATHYEISALTQGVGIFPQPLGNIPHPKSLSADLEPFPDVIDFVGLLRELSNKQ